MPYIPLAGHLPGITGLLEFRKESGGPIRELTEVLMRGPSTLSRGDRELIASLVSSDNECRFCTAAHTATADLLTGDGSLSEKVKQDIQSAPIDEKMKALLEIARLTRINGKSVTPEAIANAKRAGATDFEIHDTVLIAALFCLYNRYVDGMATALPEDDNYYQILAGRLVNHGYMRLPPGYDHLKK